MKNILIVILVTSYYLGNAQAACNGNCFNGKGIKTYENGERYDGTWKDGKKYGKGIFYHAKPSCNGHTKYYFEGSEITETEWDKKKKLTGCIEGDCNNGFGKYLYSNGEKYEGNWKVWEKHGKGTFYHSKPSCTGHTQYYSFGEEITEAEWNTKREPAKSIGCIAGNCYNEQSTYVWEDGDKYIGGFLNGKINGYGSYYWKSGNYYVGEFKNGNKHGYGEFYWTNGNKYEGSFFHDKKHGRGKMTYTDGKTKSGTWKDGEYVKEQIYSNVESYESSVKTKEQSSFQKPSNCVGDCKNGYGKKTFSNGYYEGDFQNETRHGQGTYVWNDGGSYMGGWAYGERHGDGVYINKNGTKTAKTYINGKYQQPKKFDLTESIALRYIKADCAKIRRLALEQDYVNSNCSYDVLDINTKQVGKEVFANIYTNKVGGILYNVYIFIEYKFIVESDRIIGREILDVHHGGMSGFSDDALGNMLAVGAFAYATSTLDIFSPEDESSSSSGSNYSNSKECQKQTILKFRLGNALMSSQNFKNITNSNLQVSVVSHQEQLSPMVSERSVDSFYPKAYITGSDCIRGTYSYTWSGVLESIQGKTPFSYSGTISIDGTKSEYTVNAR